jgi:hypothetical protein
MCGLLGLAVLICGLLVPAHLRAVDVTVLQRGGRLTADLVGTGLALVSQNRLGAAQLVAEAARQRRLPGADRLGWAVNTLAQEHPNWQSWGGGEYHLQVLFGADPKTPKSGSEPLTEWVVRLENRDTVLEFLRASPGAAVQALLRCRELTNTVLFPPARSSSGQALDAALSLAGLLIEEGKCARGLSNAVYALAAQAGQGGDSQPLEQVLLDLMSLGQRFNWGQLERFVARIEDPETLRLLGHFVRHAESQLPVLFSAVELSGEPAAVARYLMNFGQTGLTELGASLRYGAGGLNELVRRNQRYYVSSVRDSLAGYVPFGAVIDLASVYAWRTPFWALAVKWLLYLIGGFLLAVAVHFARPAAVALERPLQVRGFHFAREILFAFGLLLVVLLLSEPFLTQESRKVEIPFRLNLSSVGSVVTAGSSWAKPSLMNQVSLLTLLLFFVLQGLIYLACIVKLAEIRRQQVPPRVKLKLLENEDHLFDAGLYLGFVGTIISLILVSLGLIRFSLMAAYSSTSFGIIFVSFFKIFHLRPARRRLLLEVEAEIMDPLDPAAAGLASMT